MRQVARVSWVRARIVDVKAAAATAATDDHRAFVRGRVFCIHRISVENTDAGRGWITRKKVDSREWQSARLNLERPRTHAPTPRGTRDPRPAPRRVEKKRSAAKTASPTFYLSGILRLSCVASGVYAGALSLNLRRVHTRTHVIYDAREYFSRSRLGIRARSFAPHSSDSARDSARALSRLNFPGGWIGYLQPTIRTIPALLCKALL